MSRPDFYYTVRELTAAAPSGGPIRSCVDVPRFLACRRAGLSYGAPGPPCPPYDFGPRALWRPFGGLRLCARAPDPRPAPKRPRYSPEPPGADLGLEARRYPGSPPLLPGRKAVCR